MKLYTLIRRFCLHRETRIGRLGDFYIRLPKKLLVLTAPAILLCANTAMATPAFVQDNYTAPQTPQTTVTVPYTAAQTAGNLNVLVVGWNDSTAQIKSVQDSQGNTYQLAVGPTVTNGISQAAYYAKNISPATAEANAVSA